MAYLSQDENWDDIISAIDEVYASPAATESPTTTESPEPAYSPVNIEPDRYVNGMDTKYDIPEDESRAILSVFAGPSAQTPPASAPPTGSAGALPIGSAEGPTSFGDDVINTVKALARGTVEGLSTELPSLAGQAIEFATPDALKDAIGNPGKALSDWAEKKAVEWYGPAPENQGAIERIVYEGSKMLAPSLVPGGLIFKGAKTLFEIGKIVETAKAAKLATSIASAGVAGMFGLSQAQQTVDSAEQQALKLEKEGKPEEAAKVRAAGSGIAPYVTGGIEAAGEYFGTKYLGKLFRLGEAEVLKRGAGQLIKDFLKTLGVEVGTEVGQQLGEAGVEKYTAIRPEAKPFAEALEVVGPTVFMTLITGGAGAVAESISDRQADGKAKPPLASEDLSIPTPESIKSGFTEKTYTTEDLADIKDLWGDNAEIVKAVDELLGVKPVEEAKPAKPAEAETKTETEPKKASLKVPTFDEIKALYESGEYTENQIESIKIPFYDNPGLIRNVDKVLKDVKIPESTGPKPGSKEWRDEYLDLAYNISKNEKDPYRKISEEEADAININWREYSKSRGYTPAEIDEYGRFRKMWGQKLRLKEEDISKEDYEKLDKDEMVARKKGWAEALAREKTAEPVEPSEPVKKTITIPEEDRAEFEKAGRRADAAQDEAEAEAYAPGVKAEISKQRETPQDITKTSRIKTQQDINLKTPDVEPEGVSGWRKAVDEWETKDRNRKSLESIAETSKQRETRRTSELQNYLRSYFGERPTPNEDRQKAIEIAADQSKKAGITETAKPMPLTSMAEDEQFKAWQIAAENRGYTPAEIKESYDLIAKEQDEKAMRDWEKKAKQAKPIGPAPAINEKEAGAAAAKAVNAAYPGHDITYDGIQEGFETIPSSYQFTIQKGVAKGATFNAASLSHKDIKAGIDRMLEVRKSKPGKSVPVKTIVPTPTTTAAPAPAPKTIADKINESVKSKPSGMLETHESEISKKGGKNIAIPVGKRIAVENALFNSIQTGDEVLGGKVSISVPGNIGEQVFEIDRPYGKLIYNEATGELSATEHDLISKMASKTVKFGVDKTLLLQTVSKDIVNNNLSNTIANETIQNSLDAFNDFDPGVEKFIEIELDQKRNQDDFIEETYVRITDNGKGMSPLEVEKNLLKLGAKGKAGETSRGGYGMAKAGLILTPRRSIVTTVKDGIKTILEGTKEQFFGIKGAGKPTINTSPTTDPNGTSFELYFYAEEDVAKADNAFHLYTFEISRKFKDYIEKGVMVDGIRIKMLSIDSSPINIISKSPKSLPVIYPTERVKVKGSIASIYFVKDENPSKYPSWDGKFYPNTITSNDGLALFAINSSAYGLPGMIDPVSWKVIVDFERTPDVRSLDYPFIRNRTELNADVKKAVSEIVTKHIIKINQNAFIGKKSDFDRMIENSPEVNGLKILIPFKDSNDFDAAKKLIEDNDELVSDLAGVFKSFQAIVNKTGDKKLNLAITVDPEVFGYRSNPKVTGHEFYAINPFAVTNSLLKNKLFAELTDAEFDPLTAMASNLVHTLVHEYAHDSVQDHNESFTSALGQVYVKMSHGQLARLEQQARRFYEIHEHTLRSLQSNFSGMGKGGSEFRQNNLTVSTSRADEGGVGSRQGIKSAGEKGGVKYSTTETPSLSSMSLDDLSSLSFTKRGAVTQNKDGSFSVSFPNNRGFYIENVDSAGDAISLKAAYGRNLKPGEKIAGAYGHPTKTIKLVKGVGDKWTVTHEFQHFLERSGLLTTGEIEALERQSAVFNKGKYHGEEGRARWVAHELEAREKQRGSTIGKIIQKIQDIIDGFVAFGKMTSTKAIRTIESGKAVTRKAKPEMVEPKTTVPAYEKTAQRWYSQMEDFLADKLPGKGTGVSMLTTVNAWAKKGLIKQEELDWSGLNAYLASHENVTKQEVVEFLQANNVRVEEVEKGAKILPRDISAVKTSAGWMLFDNSTDEPVKEFEHKTFKSESKAIETWFDQEGLPGRPKFSQHQVPGGENYRELLLTLPEMTKEIKNKRRFVSVRNVAGGWFLEDSTNGLSGDSYESRESAEKALSAKQKEQKEMRTVPIFISSHWDGKGNVVAHIRFNERTGPNGEKVLFIEEIQSDWHQKGRKEGYEGSIPEEIQIKMKKLQSQINDINDAHFGTPSEEKDEHYYLWEERKAKAGRELTALQKEYGRPDFLIPDAPFKKTWPLLAIKRMVRYAAENGYDSIAWTPGDVQAERYDLSKRVSKIHFIGPSKLSKDGKGVLIVNNLEGDEIISKQYTEKELPDVIGKEATERLLGEEKRNRFGDPYYEITGPDLKVGGEGMKGFYDKILPAEVNKFFNKNAWGNAKVGTVEIATKDENILEVGEEGAFEGVSKTIKAWSLPVTPEMKSKSLREGMPQFATDVLEETQTDRYHKNTSVPAIRDALESGKIATARAIYNQIKLEKSPLWGDKIKAEIAQAEAKSFGPSESSIEQSWKNLEDAVNKEIKKPGSITDSDVNILAGEIGDIRISDALQLKTPEERLGRLKELIAEREVGIKDAGIIMFSTRTPLTPAQREFLIKHNARMSENFNRNAKAQASSINGINRIDEAKSTLTTHFNKLMYWIVDKNRPIKLIQEKLASMSESIDLYMKESNRPKVVSAKLKDAWDKDISPLLKRMAHYKVSIPEIEEYVHSMHAKEANAALRIANSKRFYDDIVDVLPEAEKTATALENTGIKHPDEYAQALESVIKKYSRLSSVKQIADKWETFSERPSGMSDIEASENLKEYRKDSDIVRMGAELLAINRKTLDTLYESGSIPEESYLNMKAKYKHYVPLYREGYEDEPLQGSGKGLSLLGRPVKTRMGSTRNVVNILANTVSNLERAINIAEKTESAKVFLSLVQANSDSDIWTVKPEKKTPSYDSYGNLKLYPDRTSVTTNQMRVMVDGKQYLIEVAKSDKDAMLMLRTLKSEDTQHGLAINVLSKVNRFLSMVNTSWSPEFIITNLPRDFQTAIINVGDTGLKPKNMFSGTLQSIRAIYAVERGKRTKSAQEAMYDRFRAAGGKIGWANAHSDIKDLADNIERDLKIYSGQAPVRKTVLSWMKLVEDANTSVENGVRLHIFKLATQSGMTDAKAASIASDITVDFTKKGAAGPVINAFYLFANAGIQGTYRIFRAASASPKVRKMLGGIAVAGFLSGLMNVAVGGDDDDGQDYFNKLIDSQAFLLERNAVFLYPGGKGNHVKIPLPWGYNFIWNLGVEASRAFTKDKYDALSGAGRLVSVFANAFNPLAAGTLAQMIAPTVIDPIAMVAENKNWFGGDLMPGKNVFEKVPTPDSKRYWKSVRPWTKAFTDQMNELTGGNIVKSGEIDISPEAIDLLIDTIGGSALRFFQDSVSTPYKAIKGKQVAIHEIPLLRRVMGEVTEGVDSKIYYNNTTQVFTAEAEMKAYRGTEYYPIMHEKLAPMLRVLSFTKDIDSKLGKLRKERNKYEAVGNKAVADKIDDKIIFLQKQYNKRFNQVMKQVK